MELASSARAEHILRHRTISQALRIHILSKLSDDCYDDVDVNDADGDSDDADDSDDCDDDDDNDDVDK